MNRYARIGLISGTALAAGWIAFGPTIAQKTAATPPIARYVMNVSTTTGMGGMSGGASAISMMMGGGANRETHTVALRLGSRNAATPGAPKADHFPPETARMGKVLPLVTPSTGTSEETTQFERPKGRLLLYWGCGAKAGPGQPVIIDFAKVAAGQMPPNFFSTRVPVDQGPSASNSKTFGWWPSAKGGQQPGKGSTLIGEHRVAGNYTPEIKFNLAQDYMPGITGRSNELPGGATNISWNSVTGATGYYAWAFGAKTDGGNTGDFVWWTSSATREFGGGLWDWLPPETVRRLIGEKVVMPPTQTSCTIPAEVKAAAPGFLMSSLYAYGPEANFAYPPRPANPATPWKPEWTTRVRFRSTTMWMIGGPDMGDMGDMSAADDTGEAQPKKKCKKKGGLGGLGGVLSGALGVPGDGC